VADTRYPGPPMLETLPRRSERPRRRRHRGLLIVLVLAVVLGGALVTAGLYYQWSTGASGPKKALVVTIPSGASGQQVGDLLKQQGVIRSTFGFRLMSKFRGFSSGFEAGKYHMTTNMTASGAIAALNDGPFVESLRVTFPEGYRIEQMAQRAREKLHVRESDFTASATTGTWTVGDYLPKGTKSVEGFLFPSTYDFLKDDKAEDVIRRMLAEFENQVKDLPWSAAKTLGVTDYQVVVAASLIEREARFDEDRAKIAAVIYNRLKKGMPLQIDASVQYVLGSWGPLTVKDRDIQSPYNTYLHKGLPPTPIASPGLKSIVAALTPADANYLYYVVIDAAGHHAFTASYQEFLKFKNQYQG
jgi:peptidoglycan lytic transglycosylase G